MRERRKGLLRIYSFVGLTSPGAVEYLSHAPLKVVLRDSATERMHNLLKSKRAELASAINVKSEDHYVVKCIVPALQSPGDAEHYRLLSGRRDYRRKASLHFGPGFAGCFERADRRTRLWPTGRTGLPKHKGRGGSRGGNIRQRSQAQLLLRRHRGAVPNAFGEGDSRPLREYR